MDVSVTNLNTNLNLATHWSWPVWCTYVSRQHICSVNSSLTGAKAGMWSPSNPQSAKQPSNCHKWGTAGGLAASRVYTILNCADWVSDGEPTGKNFKWRCVCWFNKTIWQRIKFHKRFVLCFGIIVYTKAMTIILHTNIQIWHKKPVSSFRAVHRLKAKTFSFVEPQSVWCFVF